MKKTILFYLLPLSVILGISSCSEKEDLILPESKKYSSEQLEKIQIAKERMKEVGLSFVENQDEEKINQFILSGKVEKEIEKVKKIKGQKITTKRTRNYGVGDLRSDDGREYFYYITDTYFNGEIMYLDGVRSLETLLFSGNMLFVHTPHVGDYFFGRIESGEIRPYLRATRKLEKPYHTYIWQNLREMTVGSFNKWGECGFNGSGKFCFIFNESETGVLLEASIGVEYNGIIKAFLEIIYNTRKVSLGEVNVTYLFT